MGLWGPHRTLEAMVRIRTLSLRAVGASVFNQEGRGPIY